MKTNAPSKRIGSVRIAALSDALQDCINLFNDADRKQDHKSLICTKERREMWQQVLTHHGSVKILMWMVAIILAGCATPSPPMPTPDATGVPNFSVVEPGLARCGQPTPNGFAWLKQQGYTNIIKLNEDAEGSDAAAYNQLGMHMVGYHPLDTLQQLLNVPDMRPDFEQALREILPGTVIHCEHGEDRTGVLVGMYRMQHGWTKEKAWQEMLDLGYTPALRGLTAVFWNTNCTN